MRRLVAAGALAVGSVMPLLVLPVGVGIGPDCVVGHPRPVDGSQLARACGRPAVVAAARSGTAGPATGMDGSLTLVRLRTGRIDGTWGPIDTSLRRTGTTPTPVR